MGKQSLIEKHKNGDGQTNVMIFSCSLCHDSVSEMIGILELPDDYLCFKCIRKIFFEIYDVYSLPIMPETKGLLRYTSKAKGKRTVLPREIRERVFKRDGHKCKHCGSSEKRTLTVDHIHPYSKDGAEKFSNYQTLCRSCNSKKGNRL